MGATAEFVGLPGSGKTTLAWATADSLQREGLQVRVIRTVPLRSAGRESRHQVILRKCLAICRTVLRHPEMWCRAVVMVTISRQRGVRSWCKTLVNLIEVGGLGSPARPGWTLIEQGSVQALWSVAYSARRWSMSHACRYLESCPLRSIGVLVEVDADVAVQRMQARAGRESRLEDDGEGGLIRAELAWKQVVRVLEASGLRYLRFHNGPGVSIPFGGERIAKWLLTEAGTLPIASLRSE